LGTIDPKSRSLLQKLLNLDADEQLAEGDLEAFLANPGLWREIPRQTPPVGRMTIDRQSCMMLMYAYMGCQRSVRPVPPVNGKQQRALERYQFEVINCFPIDREKFPGQYHYPNKEATEHCDWLRNLAQDRWFGVENIPMPNPGED